MKSEYNTHILKAIYEIDYILEDSLYKKDEVDKVFLTNVKEMLLSKYEDVRKLYKTSRQRWG